MWYIYERRKMKYLLIYSALALTHAVTAKHVDTTEPQTSRDPIDDNFENNIIDFDEDYSVKYNKKYGTVPWHNSDKFNKDSHRYTIVKDLNNATKVDNKTSVSNISNETEIKTDSKAKQIVEETTAESDYSVIPLELLSTTENILISILESTTEQDLTVIPLSTTKRAVPLLEIKQTVILPSTQSPELNTEYFTTEDADKATAASENHETTTTTRQITDNVLFITDSTVSVTSTTVTVETTTENDVNSNKSTTTLQNVTEELSNVTEPTDVSNSTTTAKIETIKLKVRNITDNQNITTVNIETTTETRNKTKLDEVLKTNSSKHIETVHRADIGSSESQEDVPIFTELDTEDLTDVPEDYYDAKDLIPTTAPKTDALSVIFGLAGSVVESVVESVAERVVPKGIFDLFKRMQRQSEALEAERLRSREENGGLGQFTRGILKSISSGLSKPLSQLMAGVRDIGSLDTDRGFVSSVASGVSSVANVANSVADAFKDRVQAIYPGTVWCGDGHASARSSDLGLFFFTDTCCRQHDACKLYIGAGETKYGLTNTGLFTRSHCGCDAKFRECLLKTNSLVSAQIGLTYFNVLGPQCFRKAHPIVKCARRTRITGQKCEEYELDYSKPKMWQWFDNETF